MFGKRKKRQIRHSSQPAGGKSEAREAPRTVTVDAVGPILKAGLTIRPMLSLEDEGNVAYPTGARALYNGAEVLTVNETGRRLLDMADGTVTIAEMVASLGLHETASEVGMFFVTLGQAGYLENRVEIELYETKSFVEVCL